MAQLRFMTSVFCAGCLAASLLVGCDAAPSSPSGAGGPAAPGSADEDPMTAYRRTLPKPPASLKPFTDELDRLAKEAKRPIRAVPHTVLPGALPYQISQDGKLIAIDVTYAPVTDEFLKKLNDFPDLERIILIGTKITDAGLDDLGEMRSLKELVIWDTQISEGGATKFRDSHPDCDVRGPDPSK